MRTSRLSVLQRIAPVTMVRVGLGLAIAAVLVSVGTTAAVESGTEIVNRAEIRWFDPGTGTAQSSLSNRSSVVVAAVPDFVLAADPETIGEAGAYESVAYRLENTGNVADRFGLDALDLDDDAGTLADLAVFLDVNGNGIADAGEPRITRTPRVAPGDAIDLVVAGTVPPRAMQGERYALALQAVSEASGREALSRADLVIGAGSAEPGGPSEPTGPTEPTEPTEPTDPATPARPATLRFVEPSQAIRDTGRAPDFDDGDDFVDSGGYRLQRSGERYGPVRDGAYLELTGDGLESVAFMGEDGPGRYVVVDLHASGTDDRLQVVMLETGPGTGVYRSLHPIRLMDGTREAGGERAAGRFCPGGSAPPAAPRPDLGRGDADCLLSTGPDATLEASLENDGSDSLLTDTVITEAKATVFDAFDLAPVAGATVTVLRGPNGRGGIARDRLTGEPAVSVTDERGEYVLPMLGQGEGYALLVEPPERWVFPSYVPPEMLPSYDVNAFSYGAAGLNAGVTGLFTVTPGATTPLADIPLDPADRFTRLMIEKRALRTEAGPGDVVGYSVRVGNISTDTQFGVTVHERLPYGFKLVEGTVTIDGERTNASVGVDLQDPSSTPGSVSGGQGPELRFGIGTLEPGEERELVYALEVGAGAIDGDGMNVADVRARAASGAPLRSLSTGARVRLERTGVLSDRASLFGKVYIDADCNGLQNDAEWPIGGVKLYLDDGTFAITDENGQYSLYGLQPRAHALRIDPITVPDGITFKPIDVANAAVGDSRFVELSAGDFHRADFAASCPRSEDRDAVFEQIRLRNEKVDGEWLLDESGDYDPDTELDPLRVAPRDVDIDGDLSNGILNGPDAGRTRGVRGLQDGEPAERGRDDATVPDGVPGASVAIDPASLANAITAEQGKAGTWLWPSGDTSLDGRFVAVVRAGVEPTLFVNGQPVDAAQIGERIENRRERAQIVAWYGVTLRSGVNRVEVRGVDAFGNTRLLAKAAFKRPAMGTRMVLRARTDTLPADGGRTVLPIEINILDDNDYPAQGVHFVTLEAGGSDGAAWLEEDLQDSEPGHQVRVQDGRATVHLKSSEFTGTVNVRARANDMAARLRVFQIASLRPLFGVGLLELDYGASRIGDGAPTRQADGLDGDAALDARLSMFLKGRVRGNAQLTLSYDTEKDSGAELLRDINPNAHYPVHGDASVRGYEAQSRSKLYAKLERGKNSLMWGDYLTDADADTVADLASAQRVLTGLNGRYDRGRTRLRLFAARPEDGRGSEEIRGNGTAMLFALQGAPIVPDSEVVELVVRDRRNPGLVISARRLSRFGDYLLDPFAGQLTFSSPVPSFDESLNPVFVRVSYDLESGGEPHDVVGARVRHAFTDALIAGVSYTDDAHPETGERLGGVWLEYRPDERTAATIGIARLTHNDGSQAGDAQRVGIERRGGEVGREHLTELVLARASVGFTSTGAAIASGREEASLRHTRRLGDHLGASVEATRSEALTSNELRSALGIAFDRTLGAWTLRGGVRHIRQRTGARDDRFNTALLGAARRFALAGRPGSVEVEYERDIVRASRDRVSLGGKLQVHEHAHVYARYERQNGIYGIASLGSQGETRALAAGVESDVLPNTRLYSEYRIRGAFGGRDLETGSGLRGNYTLRPGLSVSPALEVVDTIAGDDGGDGLAVSLGALDTRNPNAKATARVEMRRGRASDYVGLRGTYVARLDLDWTLLLRDSFTRQDSERGGRTMRHSFTTGLARRPRLDNRHHMLFQYQFKQERTGQAAGDRDVHVLSTHQNLQLGPRLTLSGRVGGKRETTFAPGADITGAAYLLDTRLLWDIDRRWGLDLRGGLLATGRRATGRRYTLGLGASYVVDRNLLFQLGYNVAGFRDDDLDPEGYDARGVRFGLRYKFDDSAFGWLQGERGPDT